MNPARHHTLNQTAHIFDSTSHTQIYRPASPLSPSTMSSPTSTLHRGPSSAPHQRTAHLASPSQRSKPKQPNRTQNLHIPGLPRYHPANFLAPSHPALASFSLQSPSPLSMSSSTNDTTTTPTSPQSHQRFPSADSTAAAQRLFIYQRDILEKLHRISTGGFSPLTSPRPSRPTSPQLEPLMSPGDVVTPLELELDGQAAGSGGGSVDGYLMAKSEVRERAREIGVRESLEEIIGRERGTP